MGGTVLDYYRKELAFMNEYVAKNNVTESSYRDFLVEEIARWEEFEAERNSTI